MSKSQLFVCIFLVSSVLLEELMLKVEANSQQVLYFIQVQMSLFAPVAKLDCCARSKIIYLCHPQSLISNCTLCYLKNTAY